jgi:hypothetical protein
MTREKHARILETLHPLMLEALRSREQEIFKYLTILGPALGGFAWLLHDTIAAKPDQAAIQIPFIFVPGTLATLLLLLLGAVYSLALGYNYRYITLLLAKLECVLGVRDAMLLGWPKSRCEFLDAYTIWCFVPWCTPPEVIKPFWYAFVFSILGVATTAAAYIRAQKAWGFWAVALAGISCFLTAWILYPIHFGCKLRRRAKAEPVVWPALDDLSVG